MSFPNRRRGHGSDEDEEDGLGGDAKRYRGGDGFMSAEDKLEDLILKIGEADKTPSAVAYDLEQATTVLEGELGLRKSTVLNILLDCAVEVPEKLTVYTTLVGLLNAKSYSFGGEYIDALMSRLLDYLRKNDFDSALNCVLFIANLVNCRVVSSHSFLSLLDSFIAVTVEQDVPQGRCDWYTYAILSALPYVGKECAEKHSTVLEQLLEGVVAFLNKREKLHVPMLQVWSSNTPHPQEEYLDCLWAQIDKLRSSVWEEGHISRYYTSFEVILAEALQHNLPTFIPPPHSESSFVYPLPRVIFRLFDYTDCPDDGPELPGAHTIERFLIEQDLSWIIRTHHRERKSCATALVTYAHRGKIPLNYMIVEVIFSQLFNLPTPPYLELFYGSLLIELCKLEPNSMPQVLAQAAEMLYQRIDTMQVACFDRFVDWFSYHLSNFQFRWSWDDWSDSLDLTALKPKQLFVREVLVKCMRLSYHQRILDIMPSKFSPLFPVKPEANFKYARDEAQNLPGTSIAQELAQMIRKKCSPEEALEMLKKCPNPARDIDDGSFNPLQVDVFFLTLLHLGSKSFSHSFAALAKYHNTLKSLTENNERAQATLLNALYELWNTHTQMLVVLVDKLLKMQIVDCREVVNFLFSEAVKDDFLRMYVWEILLSALSKLARHLNKLREELDYLKARAPKHESMDAGDGNGNLPHIPGDTAKELEQKLTGAESVQRGMFLTLFQKFVILLSEHLLQCETEGKSVNTDWFHLVTGRLRQVFLLQHKELEKYTGELEHYLFTNETDPHILEIFHQFCALRR